MRRRPILILALAVLCGGLAAYLTRAYLRSQLAVAPPSAPATAQVAVAVHDLPIGSILTAEDVRVIDWPAGARPAGYVGTVPELVGQSLLLPVRENEPLLKSKLATSAVGGLASVIPPGMRAVSVKADEVIAVAGFVVPGTRVDVLVTMPAQNGERTATRVVLQNIKVVASGQSFEPTAQGKPQEASVITLLVTPAEAEILTLAATEGQIHLALRNSQDETLSSTRGAAAGALGAGTPPAPAPTAAASRPVTPAGTAPVTATRTAPATTARPRGYSVEIYNGSTRTVTNF